MNKIRASIFSLLFICLNVFSQIEGDTLIRELYDADLPSTLNFRHLGPDEGLSQSLIIDVEQGNQGFMWFATMGGLYRYDGMGFKVFNYDEEDSTSISSDFIYDLEPSKRGGLYVATVEGLNYYNPETERFTRWQFIENDSSSLKSNLLKCVVEDEDGIVWIGYSGHGLTKLDPQTGEMTHYSSREDDPASLSDNAITALLIDHQNTLWIGTGNRGLNKFDSDSKTFQSWQHVPDEDGSASTDIIQTLLEPFPGEIWMGTAGNGLIRFNIESEKFSTWPRKIANLNIASPTRTVGLEKDSKGRIWVGSEHGILQYDYEQENLKLWRHSEENGLVAALISSIKEDKQGNLWIGSYGEGLSVLDPLTVPFETYRIPAGEEVKNITAIAVGNNNIWVRSDKIKLLDRSTGQFLAPPPPLQRIELTFHMFVDSRNDLWVGTRNEGLFRYNSQNNELKKWYLESDNSNPTPFISTFDISEDRNGNILLAEYRTGFTELDPETGDYINWSELDDDKPYTARGVLESNDGLIWITTQGKGLKSLDRDTKVFTHYRNDPEDPSSLSSNSLTFMRQDDEGVLWISSMDKGLNKFDPKTGKVKRYGKKEGLKDLGIWGLEIDDKGRVWFGTNNGIHVLNPETDEIVWFSEEAGLQSKEFNKSAKGPDGLMYFVGVNGLSIFDPDKIVRNEYVPPVIITDFLLQNEIVRPGEFQGLGKGVSTVDQITLNYDDKIFGFEFVTLNFSRSDENQYAYKLEGFDEAWIATDSKSRRATYTNISPGSYIFRVKAANDNGVWNEEGASVRIVILPPWWQTWWAKILWAFLILGTLLFIYYSRVNRLKRQKKVLEEQVNNRTKELKIANDQLKEIGDFKESMTGMIAHDLKTPLSIIMNAEESPTTKLMARQMLQLVNNMLDVHHFESAEVTLNKEEVSLLALVQKSIDQVRTIATEKNIQIAPDLDEMIWVSVDEELMNRVFVNLFTNAIKFSPPNGKVLVQAKIINEQVSIAVSDEGPGIPKDQLEHIFNAFGQVEAREVGGVGSTGLGLTFCKLVLAAHGYQIEVDSQEGIGSTFKFSLDQSASKGAMKKISSESLALESEDVELIAKYISRISNLKLHQAIKIEQELEPLRRAESQNAKQWVEALINAAYLGNQKHFDQLIKMVMEYSIKQTE